MEAKIELQDLDHPDAEKAAEAAARLLIAVPEAMLETDDQTSCAGDYEAA